MGLTRFPRGVSSYGIPLFGGGIPAMTGDVWHVDCKFGSDDNDGKTRDNPFETITKAEDTAGDGTNDIILLDGLKRSGGPTYKYQESASITWDKDVIHMIGLGNWGAADPDPQWSLNSTGRALDAAATLYVTGTGNTFSNMTITGNGTHANCLYAVDDSGEGTVYTNVQFMKTNDLDSTSVADIRLRGDTSTFRNCKFGAAWYTIEVARTNALAYGVVGTRMKSNYFEDCYFVATTDDADFTFFKIYDTSSCSMENVFKNCVMINAIVTSESGVQSTVAVSSASGLAEGSVLFVNPASTAASFSTTSDGFKVIGHGAATTAAYTGVAETPS